MNYEENRVATRFEKRFAILIALVFSAIAWAWAADAGQEGHGGNAIVCFNDKTTAPEILASPLHLVPDSALSKIASIQALDLYEAERMQGEMGEVGVALMQPELGETNKEYLIRLFRRYQYPIPLLGREIMTSIERLSDRVFVYGTEAESAGIAQAFDVGALPYVIDSSRCLIVTVARQAGSRAEKTIRLDIDGRLMNHPKHTDLSRKILMLHEVIYAWALDKGHLDSSATRLLVAKLVKSVVSRQEIFDVLTGYGFAKVDDPELLGESFLWSEMERELQNIAAPVQKAVQGNLFYRFMESTEVSEQEKNHAREAFHKANLQMSQWVQRFYAPAFTRFAQGRCFKSSNGEWNLEQALILKLRETLVVDAVGGGYTSSHFMQLPPVCDGMMITTD